MRRVTCPKCGKLVEYEDKSTWEGNRDFEDVNCPSCDEHITRVFTNLLPNPRIVDDED